MNSVGLLKNHAINILDQYAKYYSKQNAKEIDGNMVPDSLFIYSNNDKYHEIADRVISYLCAYMNIDRSQITENDFMDIKGILMVRNNITLFEGSDINPDYVYDFTKSMFCECHKLNYNEILDKDLAYIFDKEYIDSFIDFEFKKYLKLGHEYTQLKNIKNKTDIEYSRIDILEKVFANLQETIHKKYNKLSTILTLKEKNLNKELVSEDNFNICFFRELMNLYDPINNDKEWLSTIKEYIKEDDLYSQRKLEQLQLEIGNYYVKSIMSDHNRLPEQEYPNLVSSLDDITMIKSFFDKYFNFFEIGFRKFEDISKENTSRV